MSMKTVSISFSQSETTKIQKVLEAIGEKSWYKFCKEASINRAINFEGRNKK